MEDESSFLFSCWRVLGHNKKPLSPQRDKGSKASALPPKLMIKSSTHFAYHHMHPTDNGRGSRRRLLPLCGFKPPSQAHSESSVLPHSHQPAALWIHPRIRTTLAQRFNLWGIIPLYKKTVNCFCVKTFFILSSLPACHRHRGVNLLLLAGFGSRGYRR